jgi:hypothetical protein
MPASRRDMILVILFQELPRYFYGWDSKESKVLNIPGHGQQSALTGGDNQFDL